jgi:hypothetical protein
VLARACLSARWPAEKPAPARWLRIEKNVSWMKFLMRLWKIAFGSGLCWRGYSGLAVEVKKVSNVHGSSGVMMVVLCVNRFSLQAFSSLSNQLTFM